jgi:polyisoprenoid-binding protein YceI
MKRPLVLLLALPLLTACPAEDRPAEPEPPAEPAAEEAPLEIGPAPEPVEHVPQAVQHARNPDHDPDAGTPTEAPPLDRAPGQAAFQEMESAEAAALAEACAADPERVIRLSPEGTRIGYVAFRDFELRVPGMFEDVGGFGVTGEQPRVRFHANVLSLNSGDEARDGNLLKHFFRAERPENASMVFTADTVRGLENGLPEEDGASVDLTLDGQLTLAGRTAPLTVPLRVTRSGEGWDAVPSGELLLQFQPFNLIGVLPATVRACNHIAIGTAVELALQMRLVPGCPEPEAD